VLVVIATWLALSVLAYYLLIPVSESAVHIR
jgi:hypothetical protein